MADSSVDDPSDAITFTDWGFNVDKIFQVAYRFYKRNESKAFHPTFDVRNQMNALILQAKFGNYDPTKLPELGTLDLIGKSRRHEWSLLQGMSKTEAMTKFICTLDEICPIFKAHAKAVKIYSDSSQQSAQNSKTLDRQGNIESANNGNNDDQAQDDDQLKAIHTSLCRQTYSQFKSYTQKQFPNDPVKQREMITTLQEQYYQQYISNMQPELRKAATKTPPTDHVEDKQEEKEETNDSGAAEINTCCNQNDAIVYNETNNTEMNNQVETAHVTSPPDVYCEQPSMSHVASWACSDDDDGSNNDGSPLRRASITYDPLEPATIWTKKGVAEFKDSLSDDKQAGVYMVNQGILLTIQVPTYPDGKYIYWEFATDDYDIGFGVDFIYDFDMREPLKMSMFERYDEDDDSDDEQQLEAHTLEAASRVAQVDLESANHTNLIDSPSTAGSLDPSQTQSSLTKRQATKLAQTLNTLVILPTYRRDSHEEVIVGRHKYPGPGYYLLKFDNTYSVLRSKSLFYRICYFI